MKALMLLTGSGPLVILTSHDAVRDEDLLEKLAGKGISKFIAFNIPLELVKARYGGHFQTVQGNLHESDDLRVLDYNGQRAFQLFSFQELGEPVYYEGQASD